METTEAILGSRVLACTFTLLLASACAAGGPPTHPSDVGARAREEPVHDVPPTLADASTSTATSPAPRSGGASLDAAPPVSTLDDAGPARAEVATVVDAGATPSPARIPGTCVDALADARARAKLPKDVPLPIEPERIDLDGDGTDDLIVTIGADARDYSGSVYITRGRCAFRVLDWRGSAPAPAATSTRGFLDLEGAGSPCRAGCCRTMELTTFKWNGRKYERSRTEVVSQSCARP